MVDYFIPLSTILGTSALAKFPLTSFIEPAITAAANRIGVRKWHETWNDSHRTVMGTAILATAFDTGDEGGFGFSMGHESGGTSEFRFELSTPRTSLLQALADEALDHADVEDPHGATGPLQTFLRSDAPPFSFRLTIHDLSMSLRLPDTVQKGKVETDADGHPVRITPDPEGGRVEITLVSATLTFDTERGWAIEIDEDQILDAPPFLIKDTRVGFLAQKIRADLSTVMGFPEVLARPGYDETWRGVTVEKFVVFGLDSVFPTAPSKLDPNEPLEEGMTLEFSHWLIGSEGLSGSLRFTLDNLSGPLDTLSIDIELERNNPIRFGGEVTLYADRLWNDPNVGSLGPGGNLLIGFNLRFHPEGGSLVEFVLRTPGTKDAGLFTLKKLAADGLLLFGLLTAFAAGAPVGIFALIIPVLLGFTDVQSVTLDALRIRQRYVPFGGRELIIYDFVLDLQLKLALDIELGIVGLPRIHTDPEHPMGLLARGFTISWIRNFDDFTQGELGDRQRVSADFDEEAGISFEVGEETPVIASTITVIELGAGRWEDGVWFDLGLRFQGTLSDTAISVTPGVVRIYFLASGDPDHVELKGAGFTFTIPGAIHARGVLDAAGESSTVTGTALIVATKADATAHPDKPENWLMQLSFGMRKQTLQRPDGGEVESKIYALKFEHAGGLPLPFWPCTSIYGVSGIAGDNARPALGSAGPADWLMNQQPPNVVHDIAKWEGAPDEWGFGFGLVLGATADRGRPWNVKGGVLFLKPGPVFALHGAINTFSAAPKVDDTSSAAFLIVAMMDWLRQELTIGFRAEKSVPASSGKVFSLKVPAELQVNQQGFHLYFGEHWPPEKHIRAKFLDRFEIGGYVMLDTATITNLSNTGIDVPGFAIALGIRFDYEGGKKGGHFKLYFIMRAGADLAFTGNEPSLFFVRAFLTGGVVAKAWGIGFELNVTAAFLWVRPQPDRLEGEIKVTLDLPWPIPNLKVSVNVSQGEDGDTAPLVSAVEGLSLIRRDRNEAIPFPASGELGDVPVDPVLSLTFAYTMRNAAALAGGFQPDGADLSCWNTTSGEEGYAVELSSIRLFRHGAGGALEEIGGQIPARWRQEPMPAGGGQPSRKVLELFTYDGGSERFFAASADYVEWSTGNWDPCPPLSEPGAICYDFEAEELGPILTPRTVRTSDPRPLRVVPQGQPEGAESVLRFFGATAVPAVVAQPSIADAGFVRAIQLAAARGVPLEGETDAAPQLRLEFAIAASASVEILRLAGGSVVLRSYWRGELVEELGNGEHLGWAARKYERVRYHCGGPIDEIEIAAAYPNSVSLAPAYLAKVCLIYRDDVSSHLNALENAAAFSQFWSSLLDGDAAMSDALLLEPGTRYTLEVEANWARVSEGAEAPDPSPLKQSFSFSTVPLNQPPLDLRGPEGAVAAADWDVRTTPAHQQLGVYPERPFRLEFRDARTESVYAKFGCKLVLRLVDEFGEDLFDQLAILRDHAGEMPEFQAALRDRLLQVPCAPDIADLFVTGTAHFASLLATGRWYDGSLVLLPDTIADPSTVTDWTSHPVAYRFRFRTSAWRSLAEHAEAYRANVVDELCEAAPDLSALGSFTGRTTGAQLLETAITEQLHLLSRPPAERPELVRIWRPNGPNPQDVTLTALLLDGPEALVAANATLSLEDGFASAIDIATLSNETGTRVLVLPKGPIAGSELRLTIGDPVPGPGGTSTLEEAGIIVALPARPPFLEQEAAP